MSLRTGNAGLINTKMKLCIKSRSKPVVNKSVLRLYRIYKCDTLRNLVPFGII